MRLRIHPAALLGVAALALLAAAPSPAAAQTVQWTGATTDSGSISDFDTGTKTFAGFTANQITSFTGTGYAHDHGSGSNPFTIELNLNGSWTNVFSRTGAGDLYLQNNPVITFTRGTVTGLRLGGSPVGYRYHGFSGTDTFTFADTGDATVTPEPVSLALFAPGLAAVGLLKRRKKNAKNTETQA